MGFTYCGWGDDRKPAIVEMREYITKKDGVGRWEEWLRSFLNSDKSLSRIRKYFVFWKYTRKWFKK